MSADLAATRQLVRQLSSPNDSRRRMAERVLESMGPDGIELLLKVVDAEQKRRRKRRKYRVVGVLAMGAIALLSVLIHLTHTGKPIPGAGNNWMFIYWLMAAGAVGRTQRNATLALTKYDDVRAVGAFADGLGFQSWEMRRAMEDALIRLLPRLRASDSHLLNEAQRRRLNMQLERRLATPALVKAILLAWQQVGDQSALPYVRSLAANRFRDPALRRAAQDCLPYLTQRVAEQNAANTLLRAADEAHASPDELLRPAHDPDDIHASELLRADRAEAFPTAPMQPAYSEHNEAQSAEHLIAGAQTR